HSPFVSAYWFEGETFRYCGLPFHGWIVACVLIATVPFLRARLKPYWLPFALLAATAVELRFLMSWPNLWPQYYLLWSFSAALVFAVMASTLLRRNDVAMVTMLTIVVIGARRIPQPAATLAQ